MTPIEEYTTRLLVRLQADHTPGPTARAATYLLLEPGDWLIQRFMLAGITASAERTDPVASKAPTGTA